MEDLKKYIRTIPDYPKPGVLFRDMTTVVKDAEGLRIAIDSLDELLEGVEFDMIAGLESRGFIFGMPVAYNPHKPFVLIRKKGKLPAETVSQAYELEYGTAEIEVHKDAIAPGDRVVLVDDLIATGGSLDAGVKLIEKLGGKVVKIICLMELTDLGGREKLKGYDVATVVQYEGE